MLVLPAFLNLLAVFLQGGDQNISSYFVHVPVPHISQVQIHHRHQEQDLKRRMEPRGFWLCKLLLGLALSWPIRGSPWQFILRWPLGFPSLPSRYSWCGKRTPSIHCILFVVCELPNPPVRICKPHQEVKSKHVALAQEPSECVGVKLEYDRY